MESVRDFQITRRALPHWQQAGSTYFVTWRTAKSRELTAAERSVALNAVLYWNATRWMVYAAVIMPDHAHVLAKPLPKVAEEPLAVYDLAQIIHSVKGYSAQRINALTDSLGSVWQQERYDRLVRDEREFSETWRYIIDNPVRAGLVQNTEDYQWLYQSPSRD